MAFYPEDIKMASFKYKTRKEVLVSNTDVGYKIKRPKYTRATKEFTFNYKLLDEDSMNEIENFLIENRGLSFSFIHPLTKDTHTVTQMGDMPEITFVNPSYYNIADIILEEV